MIKTTYEIIPDGISKRLGVVATTIKSHKGEFLTPDFAINSTYYNYIADMTTAGLKYSFPNNFYELQRQYTPTKLELLSSTSNSAKEQAVHISRIVGEAYDNKDRFIIAVPHFSTEEIVIEGKKKRTSIKELTWEQNKLLIQLYLHSNVIDVISVHPPSSTSPIEDVVDWMKKSREMAKPQGRGDYGFEKEIAPIIDLSVKPKYFKNLIERLISEKFRFFTIRHRKLLTKERINQRVYSNLSYIKEKAKEMKYHFHATRVDRRLSVKLPVSMKHILHIFGFNTFCLPPGINRKMRPLLSFGDALHYDGLTLGVMNYVERNQWHRYRTNGFCLSNCPVCKDKTFEQFNVEYDKKDILHIAIKIHEAWESHGIFMDIREAIINDRLEEKINEKYFLEQNMKTLLQIKLKVD